ncbi:MAG: hypothetical protein ACRD41_09810, partial [Candidatus Acidiferrales bacterium]
MKLKMRRAECTAGISWDQIELIDFLTVQIAREEKFALMREVLLRRGQRRREAAGQELQAPGLKA